MRRLAALALSVVISTGCSVLIDPGDNSTNDDDITAEVDAGSGEDPSANATSDAAQADPDGGSGTQMPGGGDGSGPKHNDF